MKTISKKELEDRIEKAKEIIVKYGGIDGAHHKNWVIDQAFRHLCGCPQVLKKANDCNGKEYEYLYTDTNKEYKKAVKEAVDNIEDWDIGITP